MLLAGLIRRRSPESAGGGGEPPPPALPDGPLDPLFGAYAPEDADVVLSDFGKLVYVEGLGSARILFDTFTALDTPDEPVQVGRSYRVAKFKRGVFNGAALNNRVVTIQNGVTQSTHRLIGPIERPNSLYDHYVLEPRRREAAA